MTKLTINDIARLSGVSKKTVSKVLNQSSQVSAATRAKVQAVIADHGYVPNPQARALALRRNFLVALVHDGSDPWALLAAQEGAQGGLAGGGYALVVQRVDPVEGPLQIADFIAAHRPAGLLLLPPLADDPQVIAAAAACPVVRLAARDSAADTVVADERGGIAAAVTRLVGLGHRRIAMITGPDGSSAAQARELGYLDALADHDLDRGPALVASGDFSIASGHEAGRLLLQVSPRPTAIVAANDAMAAGALHAALAAGLAVPRDLSIVGSGDGALADLCWPPLSGVRVPLAEMAEAAARRIMVPGGEPAGVWPAPLVERGSIAPVPE